MWMKKRAITEAPPSNNTTPATNTMQLWTTVFNGVSFISNVCLWLVMMNVAIMMELLWCLWNCGDVGGIVVVLEKMIVVLL